MHPALNPYVPGSGLRPAILVGRDDEINEFDLTVAKSRARRISRGIVLYGLRGVGKTVLLNQFRERATQATWVVANIEGRGEAPGLEQARLTRAIFQSVFRELTGGNPSSELREAFRSVVALAATQELHVPAIGLLPAVGRADSGLFELDLEEAIEDVATVLKSEFRALALFVDEMQELNSPLLATLLSIQHRAGQLEIPFYLIGAGLPQLPAKLGELRSYAERLFDYRQIGPLSTAAAHEALAQPAQATGARYTDDAIQVLLDAARGYAYFIQAYGQATWNAAPEGKIIALQAAEDGIRKGNEDLDSSFFLSRWDRVTPAQKEYLRAMAEIGDSDIETKLIAQALDKPLSKLSVLRQTLVERGLVYAPRHGQLSFTLPGMASYILRKAST